MTFQIGDRVQIKNLTENERQNLPLFYSPSMTAYEGKIGIIIDVCNDALGNIVYLIEFPDKKSWCWLKDWIEPTNTYNAF